MLEPKSTLKMYCNFSVSKMNLLPKTNWSFCTKCLLRQESTDSKFAVQRRGRPLRTAEDLHAQALGFLKEGVRWREFQKRAHLNRRPLEERIRIATLFGVNYRPYKQRKRLDEGAGSPKEKKPSVQAEEIECTEARETSPRRSDAQETEELSPEQATEQSDIARVLTLLEERSSNLREQSSNLRELVKQGSLLKPSSRVAHLDVNTTPPT